MSATTAVVVAFCLTYLGIALGHVPGLKMNRTSIVLLGAIAMAILSRTPSAQVMALTSWPTVLLLFGFFIISAQLRLSGFFDRMAGLLAAGLGHPALFLLSLMLGTAALSALLNHDIVCFVFTPVVGAALLGRGLNPAPFLIALAISSNIGSAATVVGNAQDMVIAQVAGLSFARYALWCFPPVAFALFSAYGLIWLLSRKALAAPGTPPAARAPDAQPFSRGHTIKGLVILALVILAFFTSIPKEVIALIAAAIHLASPKFRTDDLLGLVDWQILILFMGLFVVTGIFQSTGCGEQAVAWLARTGVDLRSPTMLAVITAALSNLINNSAAVMLLVKVVDLSHASTAYILALANSFGGSLIITGSVANIIVVQQAKEIGVEISFLSFLRLGVPVTVVAIIGVVLWAHLMG